MFILDFYGVFVFTFVLAVFVMLFFSFLSVGCLGVYLFSIRGLSFDSNRYRMRVRFRKFYVEIDVKEIIEV